MNQTLREPVATETAGDSLYHYYVPWSLIREGTPPVGARALCGHVKRTELAHNVFVGHPAGCVVCCEMAKDLR